VVGAGAAGLYTAVCAAREGARVTLVSATPLAESSSWWAQGGLAAAVSADDSPELHLRDTVVAGRKAVRESAARVLCDEAPEAVADLGRLGVRFDADRNGRLALGLEGGHSRRRIVHAGGAATGRRLVRQLSAVVAEHPGIDVLEGRRVVELIVAGDRCVGVRLDDGGLIASGAVVLATVPPRCGRARRTRRAQSAAACSWRTPRGRRWPTSSSCSSIRRRSSAATARTDSS